MSTALAPGSETRERPSAPTPVPPPRVGRRPLAPTPEPDWSHRIRLGGLRRFAFAITLLNVVGHLYLGFEMSWAHPLSALLTAYSLELLLESVDARANRRTPRYRGGGLRGFVDFLLSAHISALAVSMLLYPGERLFPTLFATAVAIGSKKVLQVPVAGRRRHFLNPSNAGISLTLLLFPWVGIAPPYQFTENVAGALDWLLPLIIVVSGTFINLRFTSRLPLLLSWLLGFFLQALLRSWLLDAAPVAALAPMTGLAFVLFTFYMITDPPTTPSTPRAQVLFGLSVAATYGLLMACHVVFGLFFSLSSVCLVRGSWLFLTSLGREPAEALAPARVVARGRIA